VRTRAALDRTAPASVSFNGYSTSISTSISTSTKRATLPAKSPAHLAAPPTTISS
jgi:hypothetical protein